MSILLLNVFGQIATLRETIKKITGNSPRCFQCTGHRPLTLTPIRLKRFRENPRDEEISVTLQWQIWREASAEAPSDACNKWSISSS